MAVKKSHFSTIVRAICVLAAVMVPVAVALRGAWGLGAKVVTQQSQDNEKIKYQEIRDDSQFLSDKIFDEIEAIKIRAIASVEKGTLEGDINDGSILAVSESTRNIYVPSFLNADLQAASRKGSEAEMRGSGFSLFPVEIKTSKGGRTLGLSFEKNSRKFLAIIDPIEAFKKIALWSAGKDGGFLKGYLVDGKGLNWDGTSLFKEQVFQEAIAPIFRNQRTGGIGIYSGAHVSYFRLGTLPYVVVAERSGVQEQSGGARLNSILQGEKNSLYSTLCVLILTSLGSVLLIFTAFDSKWSFRFKKTTVPRGNRKAMEYFQAEQLRRAEQEFAEKTKEIEFLRSSLAKSHLPQGSRNLS